MNDHPTVIKIRQTARQQRIDPIDPSWLRETALAAGADDCGIVSIGRPEVDDQREAILRILPGTRTLLCYVCRMNRTPVASHQRSVANLEFHQTGHHVDDTGRKIVEACERIGIQAVNSPVGFPLEASRYPEVPWDVSHKPLAVAAGLGQMGIHRNVIHPRFGNFILLGTVLIAAGTSEESKPVDYNPCLSCKLCVAACPTGAIAPDGHFDFTSCYTHNYREFLTGFNDWVEMVADSKDRFDYRAKMTDAETVSMWQSLSFGANYKSAYCIAVCPAGEEVIPPFLDNRKEFLDRFVTPLQKKVERIYAAPGGDAEEYVRRRYPHKTVKNVSPALRPDSITTFLFLSPKVFQRGQSKGLDAVYHFTFTGKEERKATMVIRNQTLTVEDGHTGKADVHVTADSETWVGFVRKEKNLVWALVRRAIKVSGPPKLLAAFGKCFPA